MHRLLRCCFLIVLGVGALWGGYRWYSNFSIERYSSACNEAMHAGRWTQLETLATEFVQRQPTSALPWLYLAEASQKQGDVARAAELLERLPDGDSRTPAGLLELSGLYFGTLNQPLKGVKACERILLLQPQMCEARRRLTFFYALTMQKGMMLEEIQSSIYAACDTAETYLYLIGSDQLLFSNGVELNSRWLQSDPDNEHFQVARALSRLTSEGIPKGEESGDVPGAADEERALEDLLARFPHNLELLARFLKRASTSGNVKRVAELLAQAPAAAATDSRFWRYQGWLHAARNELEEAVVAYQKSLRADPYDWRTRHYYAATMRRLRRMDEVEQLEALAVEGKELQKTMLQLPDVRSASPEVLIKMATYAEHCGETAVSQRLRWFATAGSNPLAPVLE